MPTAAPCEDMMHFVYEPCRPCLGARELPHVLLPADKPVVTFLLNSPIPYGAHEPSHQYQTATLASIVEGTPSSSQHLFKRLDVRPPTHILPLDLQSECTLSPNGRPSKFSFCQFVRKGGFPFNFLWHHGSKFVNGQETGSEKPVTVWIICLWILPFAQLQRVEFIHQGPLQQID